MASKKTTVVSFRVDGAAIRALRERGKLAKLSANEYARVLTLASLGQKARG